VGPACQLGKKKKGSGGLVYWAKRGKRPARVGPRSSARLLGPAQFAELGHGPSVAAHSLSSRLGPRGGSAPSTDRQGPPVSEAADLVWQDRIRCGCRAVWPCVCLRPAKGGWGALRTRRRGVGRGVRARRGLGEVAARQGQAGLGKGSRRVSCQHGRGHGKVRFRARRSCVSWHGHGTAERGVWRRRGRARVARVRHGALGSCKNTKVGRGTWATMEAHWQRTAAGQQNRGGERAAR